MGELKEDINEMKELLKSMDEKKKEKKFRFPLGKKVGKGQRKKNYLTVLVINENGIYDFKKYQIDEQTVMHNMIPRLATAGHVISNKKGNPMIILPNWSVVPFSPADNYQKSLNNGSNTKGYQILMNKMLKETVGGMKKKLGGIGPWIVGAVVLVIIGYALITGGA